MNISNDYFIADTEEVESDIYSIACYSPPLKLNVTDPKTITSYFMNQTMMMRSLYYVKVKGVLV